MRWPGHEEVPAIGRQWAAARALAELGRRLGDHAFADVAANALDRPALGRDRASAPGRGGR